MIIKSLNKQFIYISMKHGIKLKYLTPLCWGFNFTFLVADNKFISEVYEMLMRIDEGRCETQVRARTKTMPSRRHRGT